MNSSVLNPRSNLKIANPGKIRLITMGCAKNRVDSEHIIYQLSQAGLDLSFDQEDKLYDGETDTLIINTCGFIKDAKEESIEIIFKGIKAKLDGVVKHILVFGCLSQRYLSELRELMPEVDGFFGAFDVEGILNVFSLSLDRSKEFGRVVTTSPHWSFLKISEGCDRVCSYCAIPMIRGPHRSVPIETLVREAEFLADKGVKELNVVAQDTTYYGLDLYGKRSLALLLSKLEDVRGIEWIRLLYSYPASFPDDVLEIMASSKKICKYLDIPLQHSSDKVLSAMRRSIDGVGTRNLIKRIREKVPDIVLRTTMITGHPGEGKREFEDLLSFVQECRFERLGAFTYSQEEGTYGALQLKDTVPAKVKQERYERLMEVQSQISLEYNRSRIGTTERVLIEDLCGDRIRSRSMKEAPEVDGEILIDFPPLFENRGDYDIFAEVKIEKADEYDLYAKFSY